MQIIQTIRDKGAAIVIGVIALSLIGFLLMDARSGTMKNLFGDNSTSVGSVNGKSIELEEYNAQVKQAEQNYGTVTNAMRPQIMQGTWDNLVAQKFLSVEFDKLGI